MAGTGGYQDDEEGGGAIGGINVTPLVDITLVLLIIFMVTASYIVNPGLRLDLPKAQSGEAVTKTTLGVALQCEDPGHPGQMLAQHQLLLDGKPASEDDLRRAAADGAQANPDLVAIIGADRRCEHGDVVHLLDLVRLAGVHKIAETVDAQESAAP